MSSFHKLIINRKYVSNNNLSYIVCQLTHHLPQSQIIFLKTESKIYKISLISRDSLEHELKRDGYVEGLDIPAQKALRKPIKMSLYLITPKGKKVLEGWIAFLSACS